VPITSQDGRACGRGHTSIMFKYAFLAGIAVEWITGPAVHSAPALGFACLRALMFTLLAWMILEGLAAIGRYVTTFDDGT
jgi:hypothetical protein